MSRIFLDTNAVLYFLADASIHLVNVGFGVSFITEIEILCYPDLTRDEEIRIKEFLENVYIVGINEEIKHVAIEFRKRYKLKIPDALICSSAHYLNLPLVTNDKQLFKVSECRVITYEEFKGSYTV